MNGEAIIKYSVGVACALVLAVLTILKLKFDLNWTLTTSIFGIVITTGGIFQPKIRQQYSNLMLLSIGIYFLLFVYVFTRSPEVSFQKFNTDTAHCFIIVAVVNCCLYAVKVFRPDLQLRTDHVPSTHILTSTIITFIMALSILYFYDRLLSGAAY